MEKEIQELYIEGLATHGGPESCVGIREGDGEALTGVGAGWAMEPRNNLRHQDRQVSGTVDNYWLTLSGWAGRLECVAL